jgi:molybdate transport system substrate-binding protein
MASIVILLAGLLLAMPLHAAEVLVAVAANFAQPMQRIAERFQATTGHAAKVAVGSTGRLYSQIVAGAPYELLLAADDETPARLVAEGRALAVNRYTYAIGQLVLWSAQPGLVDPQGAVLGGEGFRHLAIANPKLAPYGAAALAVLQARGLAERLAPKLVTGDSIAQAFQFVSTGNAQLGFVALSQVAEAGGSSWRVPQGLYPEIRQDLVLLKSGEANPAAQALLRFLREPATRQLIASFGYLVPD